MSLEAIQQAYDQERFAGALWACLEELADAREHGDENAARLCVEWLTDERSLLLKGCCAAVAAQDEDLLERLSEALAEGGILSGPLGYFRWPGAADRARAVLAAARAVLVRRSAGPRPPEEWQPELARRVAEAVARYNDAEPPPLQGRWFDDVPEYLRALKAEHPDWLVGPARDLIQLFQTGEWPIPTSSVRVTVPLDDEKDGVLAGLRVSRISDGFGQLYPDPATVLFVRWDRAFTEALRVAWEEFAAEWREAQPGVEVRWGLERFRSESAAWLSLPLTGPSAGAGLGLGLLCLFDNRTPPDEMWAVTGELLDATGRLGSVGGYGCKTVPFARYRDLRLIVPPGDKAKCPPDWQEQIEEAAIERAWIITTRWRPEVQDYLDALGDEKRRLSIQKPDPHAVELAVREPGGFRIVIGNVIEIHAHPSVSRPSSLLEIGWDPDKVRITDLHERFEADEFLRFAAPPHISSGTNGLKFALVEKSPDVSDNEELHLKVRRTDFYTVNDSVPVLEANPALREKFARLDPSQSQIPHSINLEYTVRFNDGHILGWFRENLAVHNQRFSFTGEEQLKEEDFAPPGPMIRWMRRTYMEEVLPLRGGDYDFKWETYSAPTVDSMRIWSVFVEEETWNYDLLGIYCLNLSLAACRREKYRPKFWCFLGPLVRCKTAI